MLTRRDLLKGAAGAGALLIARPFPTFAGAPLARPTSRIFPRNGTFLAHSDLHNHTELSDGVAAADSAFQMMRDSGLDVAAITDHAVFGEVAGTLCAQGRCSEYAGINEEAWQRLRVLADDNNRAEFVAMRGFEWTTGTIGHVNVWFSEKWIDAMTTLGLQSVRGAPVLAGEVLDPALQEALAPAFAELPENATMDLFYEWLRSDPNRPLLGGGADGIAGFNHPNEYGNFNDFAFDPAVADRIVSCEALNGHNDYLFRGLDEGETSPLNACLNAGWRVGMLGVSDEHGAERDTAKARAGMWLRSLTREGVRDALEARRFFATFEQGFRLDAAARSVAGGLVSQMGGTIEHAAGPLRLTVDVGTATLQTGRGLMIQVLRPGTEVPVVAANVEITLPSRVVTVDVPIDRADGDWILLRVSDPAQSPDARAPESYREFGRAVAYASPFFLRS